MNATLFLILLSAFSAISGLITEAIKKLLTEKTNLSYNLIAITVALVVGTAGCGTYYQLNGIPFDVNNIIYMILMGLASGLVSMTSYDKLKQLIEQLTVNAVSEVNSRQIEAFDQIEETEEVETIECK